MSRSFFRTVVLAGAVLALVLIAWGQGGTVKPVPGGQKVSSTPITLTPEYLLKEIQKLKKQTNELKTQLGAAEARLASAEAKNASQDTKIGNKEDKVNYGPDYAGGGWCTKQIFLTTLDNNKTMIRYIKLK